MLRMLVTGEEVVVVMMCRASRWGIENRLWIGVLLFLSLLVVIILVPYSCRCCGCYCYLSQHILKIVLRRVHRQALLLV